MKQSTSHSNGDKDGSSKVGVNKNKNSKNKSSSSQKKSTENGPKQKFNPINNLFGPDGKLKNPSRREGRITKTEMASLIFPVARFQKLLRNSRVAKKVSASAGVFLAGFIESLTFELVTLAIMIAKRYKKPRITNRHILLGIHEDNDFTDLFGSATVAHAGFFSIFGRNELASEHRKKKTGAGTSQEEEKTEETEVKLSQGSEENSEQDEDGESVPVGYRSNNNPEASDEGDLFDD